MKNIVPHQVAYWVGIVIIFVVSILISVFILGLVLYALYILLVFKIWKNDWFAYNIRRHRIPTQKLREGYSQIKMNKYWTRYTAKYRLRNIKHVKKHTSC